MSSISKEQREILALIDAILAMTEKNPNDNSIGINVSLNPFEFLMDIIMKKVTFEEMLDWLVNILTVSLPIIEFGVKGVLLANLKATIDCNNDPRIPNWIRKNGIDGEGMYFNLGGIDFMNMMSVSPLSEHGNVHYFGTKTYYVIDGDSEDGHKYFSRSLACVSCVKQGISMSKIRKISECDNVYKLARANDFNAFLWFIVHKVYFPYTSGFTASDFNGSPSNNLGVLYGDIELTETNRQPKYSPRKLCYK